MTEKFLPSRFGCILRTFEERSDSEKSQNPNLICKMPKKTSTQTHDILKMPGMGGRCPWHARERANAGATGAAAPVSRREKVRDTEKSTVNKKQAVTHSIVPYCLIN